MPTHTMKYFLTLISIFIFISIQAQDPAFKKSQFEVRPGVMVDSFTYTMAVRDGMGKPDSAEIVLSKYLVDTAHVNHELIEKIITTVSSRAAGNLNEPSSFEFLHSKPTLLFAAGGEIHVDFNYIGNNAFGSKRKNHAIFFFDVKGQFLKDYYF